VKKVISVYSKLQQFTSSDDVQFIHIIILWTKYSLLLHVCPVSCTRHTAEESVL